MITSLNFVMDDKEVLEKKLNCVLGVVVVVTALFLESPNPAPALGIIAEQLLFTAILSGVFAAFCMHKGLALLSAAFLFAGVAAKSSMASNFALNSFTPESLVSVNQIGAVACFVIYFLSTYLVYFSRRPQTKGSKK